MLEIDSSRTDILNWTCVYTNSEKNYFYRSKTKIPGYFQVFQVFQVIVKIPGYFQVFQVFQKSWEPWNIRGNILTFIEPPKVTKRGKKRIDKMVKPEQVLLDVQGLSFLAFVIHKLLRES